MILLNGHETEFLHGIFDGYIRNIRQDVP